MSTSKTRINISLSDSLRDALTRVARRDRVPAATKAAKLLEAALEIEEDQVWDALAKKRDTPKPKFLSHDNAWK